MNKKDFSIGIYFWFLVFFMLSYVSKLSDRGIIVLTFMLIILFSFVGSGFIADGVRTN